MSHSHFQPYVEQWSLNECNELVNKRVSDYKPYNQGTK